MTLAASTQLPSPPRSSSLASRTMRTTKKPGDDLIPVTTQTATSSSKGVLLAALLLLALSPSLTTAEAQIPEVARAPPTSSIPSNPLIPSNDLPLDERNFPPQLHPAKAHGVHHPISSNVESPKAKVTASSVLTNTSAAAFTFTNSRHQYHSKISNSREPSRNRHRTQSPHRKDSPTIQTQPNLAFTYLEDMGLQNRLPFKSGMSRAGESWNDAGLRPNVDPRIPSLYRDQNGGSRVSGKGKSRDREQDGNVRGDRWSNGLEAAQSWQHPPHNGRPQWQQHHKASEDSPPIEKVRQETKQVANPDFESSPSSPGSKAQADSTDEKHTGSLPTELEDKEGDPESDLLNSLTAVKDLVVSGRTDRAISTSPEIMRWSGLFLNSGRIMLRWLGRGQKDANGIALTMLKPKITRPVVARLPMIPNDAKRDLVLLIIASFGLCGAFCILWYSRVSPEEFERAKRLKEYAAITAAKAQSDTIYEEHEEEVTMGLSSSSRPIPGYSRSRAGASVMSRRPRMIGNEDTYGGGQSEDSDVEYLNLTLDRRYGSSQPPRSIRRGSFLVRTAGNPALADRESGFGTLASWLDPLWKWTRRRNSNGEDALPLSSELSRSSTPNSLLQATTLGSDTALSTIGGRRSRSNSITTKWKLQAPIMSRQSSFANLLPSSMDSRTSSASSLQSLVQKVPFRSITPQPSTSTQRQRNREKRRMTLTEVGKLEETSATALAGFETLDKIENGKGDYDPGQDASASGDESLARRPANFSSYRICSEGPVPSSSQQSSSARSVSHPPSQYGGSGSGLTSPSEPSHWMFGSGASTPRPSELQRAGGGAAGTYFPSAPSPHHSSPPSHRDEGDAR